MHLSLVFKWFLPPFINELSSCSMAVRPCSVDIAGLDNIRAVWFSKENVLSFEKELWKKRAQKFEEERGWAAGWDCSAEATIDDGTRKGGFWTWARSWEVAFHQLAYQIEGSSQGWWVERIGAEVGRRGLGSVFARLVLNRWYFTTKNYLLGLAHLQP